jgi:hypothetical protein
MSCDSSSFGGAIEFNEAIGLNFYEPTTTTEPPTENNRRINLTWAVSRYNFHSTDGVRLRITASDAYLMPSKVFAYLLLPMKPGAGEREGAFSHVCSPTDLAEYPEDDPIPGSRPEWFRLDYVDVHLRSRSEVKALIQDIVDDVQALKSTLDIMDNLIPGGSIWIGTAPDDSSSSAGV